MFDAAYPKMRYRKILQSNEKKTIRKKAKDSRMLFEKRRLITLTLDQSKNGSYRSCSAPTEIKEPLAKKILKSLNAD